MSGTILAMRSPMKTNWRLMLFWTYLNRCVALFIVITIELVGASASQSQCAIDDTQRWTSSASGSAFYLGDPITLTWSIVPDGLTLPSTYTDPAYNPNHCSDLIATFDDLWNVPAAERTTVLTNRPWLAEFQKTFDLYGSKSGLTYVYVSDNGASWGSSGNNSPGVTRGDIRIGGTALIDPWPFGGPVAYGYTPGSGDIVLSTSYFIGWNQDVFLRQVLLHEHAHGLGFLHVMVNNRYEYSVVSYGYANTNGPQFHDLIQIHRKHGDKYEKAGGNDSRINATWLGTIYPETMLTVGAHADDLLISASETDFVSIDGSTDADYYQFIVQAPMEIYAVLSPKGTNYNYQILDEARRTNNASRQNDLVLRAFDSNGQQIASADEGGIGEPERILNVYLPAAGSYVVSVTGKNECAQMYRLDVGEINSMDTDGDGMPDIYETKYFGGPTNGVSSLDADGDGMNNYAEYLADTNPTNGLSIWRITWISVSSNVSVSYSSSTRRAYSLDFKNEMTTGQWQSVDGQTNQFGSGATDSRMDLNVPSRRIYRVRVGLPR